jgi:hypothetical protein
MIPVVNTPVPLRGNVRIARRASIQGQHAHKSVIVVHHAALGCLADQLIARGLNLGSDFRYDLALGSHWQRDAQVLLQAFEPLPRKPAAVAQHGDHARRRLIILFFARFFRRRSGKHIPAEIAPQLLQLIHRRGDGRLPLDPHQYARVALEIDFTALTIRTLVASFQRRVRNLDFARSPIRRGPVAPMPRSRTLRGARRLTFLLACLYARLLQHCLRPFRAGVTQ